MKFHFAYFPFSKITLFLAAFIVISSSFMRQVMNFARSYTGDVGFRVLVGLILIVSGLAFLVFIIKNLLCRERSRPFPTLIIIAIAAIGLFLTWQIEIPEERIHLLEFAILGWLALNDVFARNKRAKTISYSLILVFTIGVLDEGFQAILPYRYFQTWDIFLNSLGGFWGVVLFAVFRGGK